MIASLTFVIGVALGGSPPPDSAKLEAVFAPVSWATRLEDLGALFPGASIQVERLPDPERAFAVVTGAKTRALGDVIATVGVDRKGRMESIRYSSDDRRPECRLPGRAPESIPARIDCEWRGGPRARSKFAAWERVIRKELGAPKVGPKKVNGMTFVKWRRPTHEISLSLSQGDDGLWEVAVTAFVPDGQPSK